MANGGWSPFRASLRFCGGNSKRLRRRASDLSRAGSLEPYGDRAGGFAVRSIEAIRSQRHLGQHASIERRVEWANHRMPPASQKERVVPQRVQRISQCCVSS